MPGVVKNNILSILDFILPRFCCSCKIKLNPSEDSLCDSCISKIQIADNSRLQREFIRKFSNKNIISDFFSPFVFEKDKELQNAIHSLKYDNKYRVGVFLGKLLAAKLEENRFDWKFDLIIPIPLHSLKKAERGYNQSFFIAKGTGKSLYVKCDESIVRRVKYTESQTTMNLTQREENIDGAFKVVSKNKIKEKSILLIDDVITTGATISECGKSLLEAGAKNIYAASVAIAD